MSRIDGDNINLGESFVFKIDSSAYARSGKFQEDQIKALSIIEQANQDAVNIIQEARNQAEQEANLVSSTIKEEARLEGHNSGYQAGYQEGLAALNSEFAEKIRLFNDFVDSSFEIKKRIIKSAHLDIVNLIVEISDKICQKHLEIDDEVLLNITKASINLLKEKETVSIIVNPIMREKVFEIIEQLKSQNSLVSNIKIIEDSSISPDGTIVEGISGRIDSRISSQIDEITQKLLNDVQTVSEDVLVAESENLPEIADNVKVMTSNELIPDTIIDAELDVEENDSL